ncbi:MAG: helix-turn-helix domain protein [Firmicutes bacterium]|nr:helix-turn-helix domain protein [Bacillota bacterium]
MLNEDTIGQRIASLRRDKGYTQEQLSNFIHVTGQAVSKWENGNATPDTALLPALANVLGTSIDRLLTGAEFREKVSPYDDEYEKREYYWGLKHSLLAEQVVSVAKENPRHGQHLLDIGSGEGRDAIYFSKCGFIVDALEISMPGIEKIKQYCRVADCPVTAVHANMIGYEITDFYDVIYSMGALQFLPPDQRQRHFEKYKKQTCSGGLNAHLVFVEKPFIEVAPDWENSEFFYRSGDLEGFYYDWEIIQCGEEIIDCMSANIRHQHAVNYIIAKKRKAD